MSSFTVTGQILLIGDVVEINTKSSTVFKKRDLVVQIIDGEYPQQIKFQMVQKNCEKADGFKVGDDVIVHFTLRGKGYEKDGATTYFTNLDAWRLEKTDNSAARQAQADKFDDVPF